MSEKKRITSAFEDFSKLVANSLEFPGMLRSVAHHYLFLQFYRT
jgi:hypothetical protein